MIRKIIHIDEERCNGCGLCARACHEGAIDIVDGKAKLTRENFCDGFGDCLPNCPMGAITFEEREAPEYDAAAVAEAKKAEAGNRRSGGQIRPDHSASDEPFSGCPGSRMRSFMRPSAHAQAPGPDTDQRRHFHRPNPNKTAVSEARNAAPDAPAYYERQRSQLQQWPVQIRLLPAEAPFYNGAKLLIAADCTAYAYANMHEDFIKGHVTLVGCPKLDPVDYTEKLTEIITNNDVKSVTIVRMEVPCCGGLQRAAENALRASGKFLPWRVVTISCEGEIIDD